MEIETKVKPVSESEMIIKVIDPNEANEQSNFHQMIEKDKPEDGKADKVSFENDSMRSSNIQLEQFEEISESIESSSNEEFSNGFIGEKINLASSPSNLEANSLVAPIDQNNNFHNKSQDLDQSDQKLRNNSVQIEAAKSV